MVSLLKLAEITEEGVAFESPYEEEDEEEEGTAEGESRSVGGERDVSDGRVGGGGRARGGWAKNETANETANDADEDDGGGEGRASSLLAEPRPRMLLRPEDSISHQNVIGSDIMMALDDVVSSVQNDTVRFEVATYRTLRWYGVRWLN